MHWWSSVTRPAPLAWRVLFADLTQGDSAREWGLAAGLFIIHHRRRHSKGPTFREVFEHLFPETQGEASLTVEDWTREDWFLAKQRFRMGVILAWARLGYIAYDPHVSHSLRAGRKLLAIVLSDERIRSMAGEPATQEPISIQRAAMKASLSTEQAVARLRTTRRYLDGLTNAGLLHSVALSTTEVRYPLWQFSPDPNKPVVAGISTIVSSMPTDWTLATVHRFFTTPHRHLKVKQRGMTPTQWLQSGGDPAEIAILLEGYRYDID